jgi:pyruvate dehydrogenase E2 component (dihydrolipoamide acetyltransferase)
LEVDLASVEPSGSHGRVTRGDVESAAGRKRSGKGRGERERLARRRPSDGPPPAPELPDFGKWGPVERVPFRGVRRAAARQMAVSWQQIPHVTHHEEVDVTELERWRRRQNSRRGEDEAKLSLTALMFKAVAATLKRHPRFNASLDVESQEIILKHYVHIGMAIDSEDGLIVGVIREVDRKSIDELASESVELVDRVRRREVAGDELRGATFTVTNVGPLGGTAFTPVVNHPEVGILGMAQARLQQVVAGDLDEPRTDVRLMLPLSFSFDHRVNDGADAARFVSDLGEILADPDAMLMRV